jgi:diguanylate cyclase
VNYAENAAVQNAETAIRLMLERKITLDPANFTVWYNYASGNHPALRQLIDSRIREGKPFTAEFNRELYERYFSTDREAAAVETASRQFLVQLQSVVREIGAAGEDAGRYGEELETFAGALQPSTPVAELGAAVAKMRSETEEVRKHNQDLEQRLAASTREVESLRSDLERAQKQALTDALTSIGNRKQFDQQMKLAVKNANATGSPLALVLVDIDRFKAFNDNHGHLIGDLVLKLLARTLRECIKGKDTAARYGGEEFALILLDSDAAGARTVAEAIRRRISEKPVINRATGKSLGVVTISAGVAQYIANESISDFIARVDEALYAAKRSGRDRVIVQAKDVSGASILSG